MKITTVLLHVLLMMVVQTSVASQSVKTTTPESRSIVRESRQPARLEANHSAEIGARVGGYTSEVLVDIGDKVHKGDVLARIDAPELAAAKSIAEADQSRLASLVRSAKANLEAVNAENDRIQELVANNSLSEKVGLEAKSKLAAAKADHAAVQAQSKIATAKLQEAEALLAYTELKAPFDGIVVVRSMDPGDQVIPGSSSSPLFVIEDQSILRMVTYVPEMDAVLVDPGDSVTISVEAFPGKKISTVVTRASNTMNQGEAQRMRVEAEIQNAQGDLPAGLYGSAVIKLEEIQNAIVVPAGAVRFGEDPVCVYIVEGGVLKHRPVSLGLDDGNWIEVTKGLTGGEAIVVDLLGRLADGTPVTTR